MPELGPFGETFFEARVRAMVEALLVNSPGGGCVESVLTLDTHLFPVLGMKPPLRQRFHLVGSRIGLDLMLGVR